MDGTDAPGSAAGPANGPASMVEGWVRSEMGLGPETTVTVGEAPGTDPRCSPTVTRVGVAAPGQPPFTFHIERALAEVEHMDVVAALAFGGGH